MTEKANIGDMVELADKTAGFTDSVTGFDLSREQQKELTEPIGERTRQAILSGGLLIVESSKSSESSESAKPTSRKPKT